MVIELESFSNHNRKHYFCSKALKLKTSPKLFPKVSFSVDGGIKSFDCFVVTAAAYFISCSFGKKHVLLLAFPPTKCVLGCPKDRRYHQLLVSPKIRDETSASSRPTASRPSRDRVETILLFKESLPRLVETSCGLSRPGETNRDPTWPCFN